jgi:hypothetical protein
MLRKRVFGAGLWLGLALPFSAQAQTPQPLVSLEPSTVEDRQNATNLTTPGAVNAVPHTLVTTMPRPVAVQTRQPMATPPAAPILVSGEPGCTLCATVHPCSERPSCWVRGEYLLWFTKEQVLPPLVTTGDETSVGRLGFPGTQVLFGGRQEEDPRSGFRLTFGTWLGVEDPMNGKYKCLGLEGSFFWLSDSSPQFQIASDGIPILARPIVNAITGLPAVEQVANPPLDVPGVGAIDPLQGAVAIRSTSQFMGGEANALCRCQRNGGGTIDFFGGLRYLSLKETLDIREDLFDPVTLENIVVLDNFRTQNRFYGAQVGVRTERQFGSFTLEVIGKLAVGSTRQEVIIDGFTQVRLPDGSILLGRGGLLALDQTNIGKFDRDVFSVVPEITINASYAVSANLRVFLGYNFLYWSDVARPGDQIDIVVNPNFIPTLDPNSPPSREGQSRPTLIFTGTQFWAQGINLGAEWRF